MNDVVLVSSFAEILIHDSNKLICGVFFILCAKFKVNRKMSAGTAPSSSSSGGSQSYTRSMDRSAYLYTLLQDERTGVCYYLDKNSQDEEQKMWEKVAEKMGYTESDIIVSFLFQIFGMHLTT